MTYHQFRDDLGVPYGSFEVFYDTEVDPGWYWWACFPGCMPDGDPAGPFESEQHAIEDALA